MFNAYIYEFDDLTNEEIKQKALADYSAYLRFKEALVNIASEMARAESPELNTVSIDFHNMENIEKGHAEIWWEVEEKGCGCQYYDTHTYIEIVPLSYLWTFEWREIENKKSNDKLIMEHNKRLEEQKKEEERKKKEKYEYYLKLKKEFENEV